MGLLLTGLGAATGYLGNTPQARTSTSSSSTSGSFSNTGGTRRYLDPAQTGMLDTLKGRASDLMTNPTAGLAPFRTSAVNAINSASAAQPTALAARYLGSGANRSGKYGRGARLAESVRLGKIADVDNQVGQMAVARQDEGSSLMERLLGLNFGSDTTASGSTSGTQSGTQTGAGSAAAGALGGGLSTFQGLMNMLLAGGGGK